MLTKKLRELYSVYFFFEIFLFFYFQAGNLGFDCFVLELTKSPNANPSTLQFQDARQAEDSFEEKTSEEKNSPGRGGV